MTVLKSGTHDKLYIFYVFITLLIGVVSLGIATVNYLKTKEKLVQYYLYFHLSLTLSVVSDLLYVYVSINIPQIHPYIPGALDYLNVFIAKYALMVTFPVFIHSFFNVPHAKNRNLVFAGLALILCIAEHLFDFVFQAKFAETVAGDIDDLVLMLVFFYGFVTGISEYRQLFEQERMRLAKHALIFLGISMPAIIVDTLFHGSFPIVLYPIVYSSFSIILTYHLVKYSLAKSQKAKPSLSEDEDESSSEGLADSMLTEELYQQYNISPREREVLPLLIQGYSNHQIGETLFISVSTVKTHLRNIYSKFSVNNRYELIAFLKHGDERLIPRSDTDDQ